MLLGDPHTVLAKTSSEPFQKAHAAYAAPPDRQKNETYTELSAYVPCAWIVLRRSAAPADLLDVEGFQFRVVNCVLARFGHEPPRIVLCVRQAVGLIDKLAHRFVVHRIPHF